MIANSLINAFSILDKSLRKPECVEKPGSLQLGDNDEKVASCGWCRE
jgi:hypothetical protein